MFSVVSVSQFVHKGRSPCGPYPWRNGPHWTGHSHAPPRHQTWDPSKPHPPHIRPGTPLIVTSGGHHWRRVQIYSFEDPLAATSNSGYWSLNGRRKRAVRILLECFLVSHIFSLHWIFSHTWQWELCDEIPQGRYRLCTFYHLITQVFTKSSNLSKPVLFFL